MSGTKVLELASRSNGDKVLKMLIYTLNENNVNKVGIKEEDVSEEEILSLDGEPVVCKEYKKTNGEYDLKGHCATKKKVYVNGIETYTYEFGTNAVGRFENTQIEDIEIDGVTKRCVTSEAVVWKRFKNVISAIEKLGDKLTCSYEISGTGYVENGITWKTSLSYLGVALLGSKVTPAYKDAQLLETIAEVEDSYDIAELDEALTRDLSEINNNSEGSVELSKEVEKPNLASLTDNDIYSLVNKAIRAYEQEWVWVSKLYPYEFVAYAHKYEGKDSDYVKYSYVVNSDETVSITSKEDVEMVFVTKASNEEVLAEKDLVIAQKNDEIIEVNKTITGLQETVSAKDTEIAELTKEVEPLREQIKLAEEEKKATEIAEKKEAIKDIFLSSALFTEEEIATEEIASVIENMNELQAKSLVADKVIANAKNIASASTKGEVAEKETETIAEKVEVDVNEKNKMVTEPTLLTFKPRFRR